uniref:PH domain-containing protein n=1 Tax=Mucochytrium quahogii TaxID=96639 RepID=A0A7S2RT59_9STRA|mmetsp:Transcript_14063/g.22977  ORF Transcript_14063/g.22977 Transcript_14063/m.22977 type:complete len:482 (+) Transcript_14063:520-1965(+)
MDPNRNGNYRPGVNNDGHSVNGLYPQQHNVHMTTNPFDGFPTPTYHSNSAQQVLFEQRLNDPGIRPSPQVQQTFGNPGNPFGTVTSRHDSPGPPFYPAPQPQPVIQHQGIYTPQATQPAPMGGDWSGMVPQQQAHFIPQQQQQQLAQQVVNPELLSMFDPFAPKQVNPDAPIIGSKEGIVHRIYRLHDRRQLTLKERDVLIAQVDTNQEKVRAAINRLEIDGDRTSVFELALNQSSPSGDEIVSSSDSDSDDELQNCRPSTYTESLDLTVVDSDEEQETGDRAYAKRLQDELNIGLLKEPPHPAAGGYQHEIPSSFVLVDGQLCGNILVRYSSKKLFRKWKRMFFSLSEDRLCLYESNLDFESSSPPRVVYRIHPCMYIRAPALKQTYSILDDGQRIYFTVLKENVTESGGAKTYTGIPSSQNKYRFDKTTHRVCKFGAHRLQELSAFSHALYGTVIGKQRQNEKRMRQQAQGPLVSGRYS